MSISVQQPLSEVKTWDDREIATAWALLDEAQKKQNHGRSKRPPPGPGGPQYSG